MKTPHTELLLGCQVVTAYSLAEIAKEVDVDPKRVYKKTRSMIKHGAGGIYLATVKSIGERTTNKLFLDEQAKNQLIRLLTDGLAIARRV